MPQQPKSPARSKNPCWGSAERSPCSQPRRNGNRRFHWLEKIQKGKADHAAHGQVEKRDGNTGGNQEFCPPKPNFLLLLFLVFVGSASPFIVKSFVPPPPSRPPFRQPPRRPRWSFPECSASQSSASRVPCLQSTNCSSGRHEKKVQKKGHLSVTFVESGEAF